MDSVFLWIFLAFYTRGLSAHSFVRVLRVSMTEYKNDLLSTHDNRTNHADCAKVCKTGCMSFTYDPETKECTTFSRMICHNDTASKSPKLMTFAKLEKEINSNPADCSEVNPAIYCSGIYRISPTPEASFDVYCEMNTADGPWTVIQNRQNGEEEFDRPWADYKKGFGSLRGNFWLGNDAIHYLTVSQSILRIELVTLQGDFGYAEYSTFRVGNETENYKLTVTGFFGNVSHDSMATHNGMLFSTFDRDNDLSSGNCAGWHRGGWWYTYCHQVNLNGVEYISGHENTKSLVWYRFYPNIGYTHMKTTRMLVKHVQ